MNIANDDNPISLLEFSLIPFCMGKGGAEESQDNEGKYESGGSLPNLEKGIINKHDYPF